MFRTLGTSEHWRRIVALCTLAAAAFSACSRAPDPATPVFQPVRPVAEIRAEALAADPPAEEPPAAGFLAAEMVELRMLDSTIAYDIRYATANNFMGARFYESAHALLRRPAAEALVRVHRRLAAGGLGLHVFDAYRPWHVTRMFWDATPPHLRDFVADPSRGSRHNRGAAVDLTLYWLSSGQPVEMVTKYDDFSERAHIGYEGGSPQQRRLRDLLRTSMEAEGFTVYSLEWWHYDFEGWERYRILNDTFEEMAER
ncbi:MAG: M15 family metallopeptidase [Gemmatimonadota bacterium]